jgi:chorismate synthase
MLALVLIDQALRHRAQCGDVGDVSPRIPADAGHPSNTSGRKPEP